eukprot:jgi/Botrbrau1/7026/Bobra.0165s0051.1
MSQAGLLPDVSVGGGEGPGCFTHLKGIPLTTGQLWWWEAIMTFTLVSVVFATAVTKPGHGNIAPLAIGFTLFASAFVGGPHTGAALNPARVLGPAMVFHCYWNTAFVYVFAELFGAFVAAVLIIPLYGFGQFGSLFDTRIFGALGLTVPHHLAQEHPPPKEPQAPQPGTRADPRTSLAAPQRPTSLITVPIQSPGFEPGAFETSFPTSNPSQGGARPLKPSLSSLAAQDRPRPSNIPGPAPIAPRVSPASGGDSWRVPARG